MASKVADLKVLKNFQAKVEKLAERAKDTQAILERLCQVGEDYARSLYGGTEGITLTHRLEENGTVGVIIANGEKIAYLEYGTGEMGRGSYEGNLPTEPISFYSTKYNQDILLPNGWTYSYAQSLGLTETPWQGFGAKAQMWKTAQYLRNNVSRIIQEVVMK